MDLSWQSKQQCTNNGIENCPKLLQATRPNTTINANSSQMQELRMRLDISPGRKSFVSSHHSKPTPLVRKETVYQWWRLWPKSVSQAWMLILHISSLPVPKLDNGKNWCVQMMSSWLSHDCWHNFVFRHTHIQLINQVLHCLVCLFLLSPFWHFFFCKKPLFFVLTQEVSLCNIFLGYPCNIQAT